MAKLTNREENIDLTIELLVNDSTDWELNRDDWENWVAFSLKLKVCDEFYEYAPEHKATLSVSELSRLLKNLMKIVDDKKNLGKIEYYEFYTLERYFDLKINEPLELDEVEVELWLIEGELTNGKVYGFERAFCFLVVLAELEKFVNDLSMEFEIIKKQVLT